MSYIQVVEYPIKGLGVVGQTLVVCTEGTPAFCAGVHPASMALSKSPALEPCLSRGSILSTPEGVYYASPNGLILASGGSFRNITEKLLTKDKWQSLVSTSTLRAARLGSAYFAFGSKQSGVFQDDAFQTDSFAQEDFEGAYGGVLIDPTNERVAFNLLSDPTPVTSVANDVWSGEIFIIRDDVLYRIDLSDTDPVRKVYKWRSKIFQVPKPGNLAAMRIYWEAPATAPDAAVDVPDIETELEFPELPDGSTYGVVRLYCDGELKWTRNLVTSGELMRLPSGFKANFFQLEFETYVSILNVQVATSARELGRV